MDTIKTLFWADAIAGKRWLSTHTVSKFIVIAGFILVFGTVSLAVYGISVVFFRSLAEFEKYGQLTALYITHAAVMMILWFGIGSTIASTVTFLVSAHKTFDTLLVLPIRTRIHVWYIFIKTVLSNAVLLSFVISPLGVAYGLAFNQVSVFFIFRLIVLIIGLTLISVSLGSLAAYLVASAIRGREHVFGIGGLVLFMVLLYALVRIIFPPTLATLTDIPAESFVAVFKQLPLNNPYLPTAWLAQILVSGDLANTYYSGVLILFTAIVSIAILEHLFLRVYVRLSERTKGSHAGGWIVVLSGNFLESGKPLLRKNILSVLRTPSETGYTVFLFSIMVFFFIFLSYALWSRPVQNQYLPQIAAFAFVWMLFFTTAFYLRLVFPLMAREGTGAWHIFSLAVQRWEILAEQRTTALLFAVVLVIVSWILWLVLPLPVLYKGVFIVSGTLLLPLLAVVQSYLGAIRPNFKAGDNPEKVSTSGMGLAALGVSMIMALFCAQTVYFTILGQRSVLISLLLIVLLGTGIILIFNLSAKNSLAKYEF